MLIAFLCFELLLSAVAQNLVTTHTSAFAPRGTLTIFSLAPLDVNCQLFGGLLKKFVLVGPSDTTLQYSYDCIQAPSSQYLMSTSDLQTFLNTGDWGSIYYLYHHNVSCQGGLLSDFQLFYVPPSVQYRYSCCDYGALSCYTGVTVERDYPADSPNVLSLSLFNDLECIAGYALNSFVFSSYPIRWGWGATNRGKYTFTCCRISELTMLPSTKPTASPSVLSTVIPSAVPSYSPSTVFPSVVPTTISPSLYPSTASPSTSPTTYTPSNEPTSSSPTYSLAPSTASPTTSPTTASPTTSPTYFPTTSSPTTSFPSENPTIQPTLRPTILQPMTLIFRTLTVGGFIAIVCIFTLIAMVCIFILCFKWLSQPGQKVHALPQDEKLVAHPHAYVIHPKKEASLPPYDI